MEYPSYRLKLTLVAPQSVSVELVRLVGRAQWELGQTDLPSINSPKSLPSHTHNSIYAIELEEEKKSSRNGKAFWLEVMSSWTKFSPVSRLSEFPFSLEGNKSQIKGS